MALLTAFQHYFESLNMIFYESKYRSVIKVDFKKLMNKIFESNHNYPGKYNRCILESKWHQCVLETTLLHHKCGLVSIFLRNSNLMKIIESISKIIVFLAPDTLQYFIFKWCQKWVMQGCVNQIPQVDTNVYFTNNIFVLYYHRIDPLRFLNRFYDTRIQNSI